MQHDQVDGSAAPAHATSGGSMATMQVSVPIPRHKPNVQRARFRALAKALLRALFDRFGRP